MRLEWHRAGVAGVEEVKGYSGGRQEGRGWYMLRLVGHTRILSLYCSSLHWSWDSTGQF